MANYCNEKGIYCNNCNERGYCNSTGCINNEVIIQELNKNSSATIIPNIRTEYKTVRICEICGRDTESYDHHICARCRLALHDLIYKDDNYGNGIGC